MTGGTLTFSDGSSIVIGALPNNGAVLECQRRGIRVPDDVAVAGFEGLEIADNLNPPITTVRIPRLEIGKRAAQMLLDRIASRLIAEPVVDLGFEILCRASTHGASTP